nr:hypothetical protein [Tanacetum cinerariifolium]
PEHPPCSHRRCRAPSADAPERPRRERLRQRPDHAAPGADAGRRRGRNPRPGDRACPPPDACARYASQQAASNRRCRGTLGVPLNPQRAEEIRQLATPWHDQVVGPLRALRTQWKAATTTDVELGALRDRLKGLELDAERELLVRLQRLTQDWPEQAA